LTTSLSPQSIEKLQLHQSGYAQAVRAAANARLMSIVGTPVATKPEEPVAVRDERDDIEQSVGDDVPAPGESDDEVVASGDEDGVERFRQGTPDLAPAPADSASVESGQDNAPVALPQVAPQAAAQLPAEPVADGADATPARAVSETRSQASALVS